MVASISRGLIVFVKTFGTVNPQYLAHQIFVHWWVRMFHMHVIFAEKITIQMSSGDLELYVH